ncbi:MAG TPA: UbiD family decarboxylase [Candidatus Binatia bacterium]|nr:UbiD family decarboxylase [Candidatus Binatia bacterium]
MKAPKDVREHIKNLEERDLLVRVERPSNKDTEIHPIVRWQFRGGVREEDRKAFLFENVIDARRKYDGSVLVGGLAASRWVYALGMGCEPGEIVERWQKALAKPIEPLLVESGPAQEVVHMGTELDREGGGLDAIAVPISTPGFDNAPYFTCAQWITKDLETGIRNVGNYRAQVKGRRRTGVCPGPQANQQLNIHWRQAAARGKHLEAALVVGGPPVVTHAAVQKIPYGVDELAVAGGLAGEPIPLVKCKTVDIEVPATAEIVLEGIIRTDFLEPEGAFGESHGYIHPRIMNPVFEISCITHRKNPVFVGILSQVTPSESSKLKEIGMEAMLLRYLREHSSNEWVTGVGCYEPLVNLRRYVVVQCKRGAPQYEVWRALHGVLAFRQELGKYVVAVDDDIDPKDGDAINWAITMRCEPSKDVRIVEGREKGHAPPFRVHGEAIDKMEEVEERSAEYSVMMMNATLKEPFPPVALPSQEYMERAREIWENELKLPPLRPQSPWYGYSLGQWDEESAGEAAAALRGEYYQTGDKLAKRRVPVKPKKVDR